MDLAKKLIEFHEGHENKVYIDSEDVLTCGIGHALHVGSHVPETAVQGFFNNDVKDAISLYNSMALGLGPIRRAAMIDMCFNLGPQLKSWRLIDALRKEDFIRAGDEMKDSKWWRQVGRRADDLWYIIMTGQLPPMGGLKWKL